MSLLLNKYPKFIQYDWIVSNIVQSVELLRSPLFGKVIEDKNIGRTRESSIINFVNNQLELF